MKISGFTLIELLVTVALIAIVATVGIPNFQSLISSNRFTADYNEILTHFHYARSEAIKRREDISVALSSSGGDWSVTVSGDNGSIRSAAGGKGQAQVTPTAGTVTFNALGRRVGCTFNSECNFTVVVGDRSGIISIEPTGRLDQS